MGMCVHEENWIALLGYTDSESLPTHNAVQEDFGGTVDAMIWILAPTSENVTETTTTSLNTGNQLLQPLLTVGIVGVVVIAVVIIVLKRR